MVGDDDFGIVDFSFGDFFVSDVNIFIPVGGVFVAEVEISFNQLSSLINSNEFLIFLTNDPCLD